MTLNSRTAIRSMLAFTFALVSFSSTKAFAQWDPEARRHIEEEAQQNEMRARELDPIIQRYTMARNEVVTDVVQLQNQSKRMRERANWYRQWAGRPGVWHREHFERTARELDEYARHNDDIAAQSTGAADNMQRIIGELVRARDMHRQMAVRMRESLGWR